MKKLKVLLALPNLDGLGVQHDVRCLMKYWDRTRFDVKMMLHRREGDFASQFPETLESTEVDKPWNSIPKAGVFLRVLGYATVFRRERPDVVISFTPYSNLACAIGRILSGRNFGLIVSEHAHVSASLRDPAAFRPGFRRIYRKVFPFVYRRLTDRVKGIAQESLDDLIDNFGVSPEMCRLIHNPIDIEEIRLKALEAVDHPWFNDPLGPPVLVAVGRLEHQKRFDLLLTAFRQVREKNPVRLALIGKGQQLDQLVEKSKELGIADDVAWLGFQANPWRFMRRSAGLLMSSDWEGLPCVLSEAMCLGVPIVSTRCPSGPAEMLLEGAAGLLCRVDDAASLAAGIESLLTDREAAMARAKIALENIYRFEPRSVVAQYETMAIETSEIAVRS